jgi:DDE family transposase
MNDDYIVPVYVIIDELLKIMNYQDDIRAQTTAAEILTIAVVAAKYFQNHHERAVCLMRRLGYIGKLSVSRFNRLLHALLDYLWHLSVVLGDLFSQGPVYIIDAMPVPACQRVRRKRCHKVQGQDYDGYCASKKEYFFGWHLHLVCDSHGIPVAFELLPARWDELVPVQHLLANLPDGALVVADKGYISQYDELLAYLYGKVRLIPKYRKNMRDNSFEDAKLIKQHRGMIETVNSQLEKMGLQRLHARTNAGIALKTLASLVAVAFTNFIN